LAMKIKEWLEKTTHSKEGELSINAIANASDIPQATLNRRVKAGDLTADMVIAISRAYEYDVVGALLELGFITKRDLTVQKIKVALADATDKELVDEIARRLDQGNREEFDKPLRPVPDLGNDENMVEPDISLEAASPHEFETDQ
ncbi:hypothetical protein, partial [Arcanobacterium phocae]|uniref:hypothetical protein n=1 Tax=Arcanobacterium phocae TaxID=131112 RepID=UPI001C0EFD23